MLGAAAYVTILGTSVTGLFALHWTAILLSACGLAVISLLEHHHYHRRFSAVGLTDVFYTFALSNIGTSFIAAIAAYLLGAAVRFVAVG